MKNAAHHILMYSSVALAYHGELSGNEYTKNAALLWLWLNSLSVAGLLFLPKTTWISKIKRKTSAPKALLYYGPYFLVALLGWFVTGVVGLVVQFAFCLYVDEIARQKEEVQL